MTGIEPRNIVFRCLFLTLVVMLLTACDGNSGGSATQPATDDAVMTEGEIAAYQEKVSRTVSDKVGGAMVDAMVEDFGISRDQAKCLLQDPGVIELAQMNAIDPKTRAVFDECGVDPAVVK